MLFDNIRRWTTLASLLACSFLVAILSGCAGAPNYLDRDGPRFASTSVGGATCDDRELRVVSFNVKFANHVDRAIQVLRTDDELRQADIILLQEMDERGTAAIADSLAMHWVYYPASVARNGRDFGNAILSCWPIEADNKIVLPHEAWLRGNRRIAVAATLRIGEHAVRVYNVHLATVFGNGPTQRRQQLEAVLEDADGYAEVILGGDFNSETVPEVALGRGYAWPTQGLPSTVKLWTLDHILLKGSLSTASSRVGVVRNHLKASDHRPVWLAMTLNRRG